MRCVLGVCLGVAWVAVASAAKAEPALLAASDPSRIVEVDVAKVAADGAPLWLRVKLSGRTELALVTPDAAVESAPNADEWLRALDFSTRVRVSPPPGALAACAGVNGNLADSGAPEPNALAAARVSSAASELELRRSLEAAGIAVDVERVAEFAARAAAPYRVAFYDAGDGASCTAALRLTDPSALSLSGMVASGRAELPLSLIVLGTSAILPASTDLARPSDFALKYLGASAGTDYVAARAAFLEQDPARWLVEAEDSSALLAWAVIAGAGEIEPVAAHYFETALGQKDGHSCFIGVQGAHARKSLLDADYTCGGADDLARAAGAFAFGDVRITRVFGAIDPQGLRLRASDDGERDGHVIATDFDATNCVTSVTATPAGDGSSTPSNGSSSPPAGLGGGTASGVYGEDSESTSSASSDDRGGCSVSVFSDSCDGDSSTASDPSSSDSCSGDGSSDSDSSDSCSGDGSSDSDSSDSSGCGKSGYDGDTCSGNSADGAAAESKSAALEPARDTLRAKRPKRLHLSLITLLSVALALPLRRQKFFR